MINSPSDDTQDPFERSAADPQAPVELRYEETTVRLDALPEAERRIAIAAIASAFAGLGAANTFLGRADAYAEAIGHGEPAWFRAAYVPTTQTHDWRGSSCALLCRRVLACAGVVDARLRPPYSPSREGGAIGQLGELARTAGARRSYSSNCPANLPALGDIVLLGSGQHIFTIVERPEGDLVFTSVDGGQGGGLGGGTEIKRVRRRFVTRSGKLFAVDALGRQRPVVLWIDTPSLPFDAPTTMPLRRESAPPLVT